MTDQPVVMSVWGALVGPLVALISFVCLGNVPLAAVLWNGGISFGGVMSFIFADLSVLPILNIYRKDYSGRVTLFLLGTFYVAMVAVGLVIELVFGLLGLIPDQRNARVIEASISLKYTSVLNVIFLILAAVLVVRLLKTGGPQMLKMMAEPAHHLEHRHGH